MLEFVLLRCKVPQFLQWTIAVEEGNKVCNSTIRFFHRIIPVMGKFSRFIMRKDNVRKIAHILKEGS